MSAYSVEHHESLTDISVAQWDALAAGAPLFLSHAWLSMFDRTSGAEAHYVVARDDNGQLVGALPIYCVTSSAGLGLYDHRSLTGGASRHDGDYPALYIGSRSGYMNEPLIAPNLTGHERSNLSRVLLDDAVAYGRDRGARIAVAMFLTPVGASLLKETFPFSEAVFTAAHAQLKIEASWERVEDYIGSLKSSRRSTVRRDIAKFGRAGYKITSAELGDVYARIAPLLGNLERRHGVIRPVSELTATLRQRALALGDRATVFLCTRDVLVGFSLHYDCRHEGYGGGVGFDYERRIPDDRAYFMLGYYRAIEAALEREQRVLHLGPGSYEAKVLRGAVLKPLWSIVVPINSTDTASAERMHKLGMARLRALHSSLRRYPSAFPPHWWPNAGET